MLKGIALYMIGVGVVAGVHRWYGPAASFFVLVALGLLAATEEQSKA